MSETQYPEFPSETPDDSAPVEPEVQEEAFAPTTPNDEEKTDFPASEEDAEKTSDEEVVLSDAYSVQAVGTDPTHSAQDSDESDLEMDELVKQVFDGKWGNGQERRNRLAAAGYDHVEVQKAVVERMNANRNI